MRPAPVIATVSLLLGGLLVAPAPTAVAGDVVAETPEIVSTAAVQSNVGIAYHRVATTPDGYAVAAWLETTSGGTFQLVARHREPGGAWSPAVQVSDEVTGSGTEAVQSLALAVNAGGDAALAWRQQDTFDGQEEHMAFAATLARGDTEWDTATVGGQQWGVSTFAAPQVVVLPDGTPVVGYVGDDSDTAEADQQVWAVEGGAGGWGTPVLLSDTSTIPLNCTVEADCGHDDSDSLGLAVDGAGAVRAVFLNETAVSDGAGGTVQRRWVLATSREGVGQWSDPTPRTSVADGNGETYVPPSTPSVVGDLSGAGFAEAWTVPGTEVGEPDGVRLSYDGTVRTFRHPTLDYRLAGFGLAGGHAAAMFAFFDSTTSLRVTSLDEGGAGWSELSDPAVGESLSSGPTPRLGVHPDGSLTALWVAGTTLRVRVSQRSPGATAWPEPRSYALTGVSQTLPLIGAADGGAGTLVWKSTVEGVVSVVASSFTAEAGDPVPPTVTMTTPAPLVTMLRTPSWNVSWSAEDEGGGVGGFDLGETTSRWDGPADGSEQLVLEDADETDYGVLATPSSIAGETLCYAARGRPAGGVEPGGWAEPRCVVAPVDDRTLQRVGSDWQRRTGSGRWQQTYLQTTRKGATLRLEGVHARAVGLLVEKGPGHGKVKVLHDGVALGTVSLDGTARKRVVVPLGELGAERVGTLVVKVVSAGRTVRVDGVYAVQPGFLAFGGG